MSAGPTETVLITGASSGIGLELARCFAADGCRLILTARNTVALEKLAAELRQQHGIAVQIITADLTQAAAPAQIFEQAGRAGQGVDILVNNAGFGLHGTFVELPLARQLQIIQVNIASLVALTGLFLPGMKERRRGGILNVGSVAGFLPGPNMAVYFASKAFVQSFSEALHEELRGSGVRVTNLCPGSTDTNFSQVARQHRSRNAPTRKMSAAEVARAGHQAFRAGKCFVVTGPLNVLLTQAPRWLPRVAVRRTVERFNRLK